MLWRHPEKVQEVEKAKVVHYCAAGSKAWRDTGKEESMDGEDIKVLVNKWWNIYNDSSLDYNPEIQGQISEPASAKGLHPLLAAMSGDSGVVYYINAPLAAWWWEH